MGGGGGGREGGTGRGFAAVRKIYSKVQSNLGKILVSTEENRSMRYVSGSMTYDQQRRLNITENQSRSQ